VGEHTGVVETISLSYTSLVTDEGRHVFVPNQTMVSTMLVNRSVGDPRRVISIRLPVALGASLTDARRIALAAAAESEAADRLKLSAQIAEVTDKTVWLELGGFAPPHADLAELSTGIRERALTALGEAKLLPV
jgi:small-conductance mechanosensitive channel